MSFKGGNFVGTIIQKFVEHIKEKGGILTTVSKTDKICLTTMCQNTKDAPCVKNA